MVAAIPAAVGTPTNKQVFSTDFDWGKPSRDGHGMIIGAYDEDRKRTGRNSG
jgi:hypothetical protein